MFYFCYFSVSHFDGPNNKITSHPALIAQLAVAPTSDLLLLPTFSWLLCLSIK
jgi:hypothetical protein